jgi:DNA-binding NarL/FixJ family response regulator
VTPTPAGPPPPIRVLLADDTVGLRRVVGSMLALDGFEVVAEVGTGAEAVALLDQGVEADVVVLDERMPDLDGIDAARALRHRRPGLAVVLYTAFPHPTLVDAARDAGVAAVLGKAEGIEALERAITRAVTGEVS